MIHQKINDLHIPLQVVRLLRQNGLKDAILAGGAVRDTYFDILPRDYDIFIQHPKYINSIAQGVETTILERICELEQNTIAGNTLFDDHVVPIFDTIYSNNNSNYVDQDSNFNYVVQVFNMVKDMIPYQLIFVETSPIEYVNTHFDVGLCKAYSDGHLVRYTKEFMHDARNHKLTINGHIPNQYQFDRMMNNHVAKLQNKFPSFTVEVADHNKQLMQNYITPF